MSNNGLVVGTGFLVVGAFMCLGVAIYRVFLSPLRSVPGPRLAASTSLWLWIWSIRGKASRTIGLAHDKFGPIVRIGPNEISVRDGDMFTKVLYRQASPYLKDTKFYDAFANPTASMFTTPDPAIHSRARRLMSAGFSRSAVMKTEPMVWEKAYEMVNILKGQWSSGAAVDLVKMSRSFTLDVVSAFEYGKSFGALQVPSFKEPLLDAFDDFGPVTYFFLIAPWIQFIIAPRLAKLGFPVYAAIPKMQKRVADGLHTLRTTHDKSSLPYTPMLLCEEENSKKYNLPTPDAVLIGDAIGSMIAGTDTTGSVLSIGIWAIFSRSDVRHCLFEELKSVWPSQESHPTLQQLEACPYLRACIKESLRYATAISGRLPRVVPKGGLTFRGYTVPEGTTISSSIYLMHYNAQVFEHPTTFDPERWLIADTAELSRRERHLVPFSTGSRACIGLNLASMMLYIHMATIFRVFNALAVVEKRLKWVEHFQSIVPMGLHVQLEAMQT